MAALAKKGESVGLAPGFKRLTATMTWAKGADFDLAAWFLTKDGRSGLVYYGNREAKDAQGFMQSLQAFPFMKLSADAGRGDTEGAGGNAEELVIASLDRFEKVFLIAWDYTCIAGKPADAKKKEPAVAAGSAARFQGSNLAIRLVDDRGSEYQVQFQLAQGMIAPKANIGLVAIIDNSAGEARVINASHTENWVGLNDTQQFVDFTVHAEESLAQW